jgi:hypothetical protein
MRWHISFSEKLKKVVPKVLGRLVVLLHNVSFRMFLETTLKEVERGVISIIEDVFNVLLHGNFEFSAGVRFPDFESAVTESLEELVELPPLQPIPFFSNTLNNNRLTSKLIPLQKLFFRQIIVIDPLNRVLKMRHIHSYA